MAANTKPLMKNISLKANMFVPYLGIEWSTTRLGIQLWIAKVADVTGAGLERAMNVPTSK